MPAEPTTVDDVRQQALTTAHAALKRAATIVKRSAPGDADVEHTLTQSARELVNTAASAASIYHSLHDLS